MFTAPFNICSDLTRNIGHAVAFLGPDFVIRMADILRIKRMFSGCDRFSQLMFANHKIREIIAFIEIITVVFSNNKTNLIIIIFYNTNKK